MSETAGRKATDYEPTKMEAAIIEALLNPASRLKTVTELCGIVGCDRKTYYRAFDKPAFVTYLNEQSMIAVKQSVAPVVMAFTREAVRGSFQHGKVLLEMAGLYVEKKEVKVDHPERAREEFSDIIKKRPLGNGRLFYAKGSLPYNTREGQNNSPRWQRRG
jgi:hypothetical protein